MNNYHILRASLSVCPARSAERTFQASLYTAPFPALSFGGADLTYSLFSPEQIRIPSTHPLRGATSSAYRQYRQYGISIHAPLAGCDQSALVIPPASRISIHAPLAGCDPIQSGPASAAPDFNPRTPCGVRLYALTSPLTELIFQSTHPLRGATSVKNTAAERVENFNPRTPCGVRHACKYPQATI